MVRREEFETKSVVRISATFISHAKEEREGEFSFRAWDSSGHSYRPIYQPERKLTLSPEIPFKETWEFEVSKSSKPVFFDATLK